MFNIFEDQLINDVVSRAEQSRVSYNLQTEEFRTLNTNLQTYLGDIKTIDDNNHQLQENIEQIRLNYFLTLENNLKRLPNDFREQSQILNDAHLQRYKLKTRTRRFISEREELKRRIQFLATNEKDQIKYINILQKQERSIRNEFLKLNEQLQRLLKYIENEKQLHRQAMNKVDDLQIQLEQKYNERSKTEFEIQTLKEEVKLMQTTKEFLNEERETIISTQTEANEYLLSHLYESITGIREDFDKLNQTQLHQIENEYKQMLQTLEENNQITNISQHIIPSEYETLQDEQQIALQELTKLNDHNQSLSERVLAMESDLYSLRNERMQELISKDNELERSKIELQTLNEKLNNLAEYDRNLKFELTLYRGVLESEYRRKQSSNNIPHLIRPTTLRTNNKNSITDRTIWLTSNTNQNKFNNQQQEEILTTRNRVQSDYDPLGEDINVQINDVISPKTQSNDEKVISGDNLWRQLIEPFNREQQQQDRINTNVISQNIEKHSRSPSTTVPIKDQSISPFEAQQSASPISSISTGTRKSPTASTLPIIREDQSASSQVRQLSTTPPELRSLSTIPLSNQTTSPTNTTPFAFENRQSSSTSSQEHQPSSRTSSISSKTSLDFQKSPLSPTTPIIPGDQLTSSQVRQSPSNPSHEHQSSPRTSSTSSKTSLDFQKSPLSPTMPTIPGDQLTSSQVRQPPSSPLQEHQPPSRTSSVSAGTSSQVQKSPSSPITPTVSGDRLTSSQIRQSPSTPSQEHQPSWRMSSIVSGTSSQVQKSPSSPIAPTVLGEQQTSSRFHESPSSPLQEHQPSSRTSSISAGTSSDIQRSPLTTTPIVPEYKSSTSDVRQSPSTPSQEHQPSSRTSSISAGTSSQVQKSPSSPIAPIVLGDQLIFSQLRQLPSTPPREHQPSSRTSSINARTSSDIQRSPLTTTPVSPEYELPVFDVHQSRSTPPQEHQPSSRTSSIGSKTSLDFQRSPSTATTPTVPEHKSSTSDVRQSPSTPPEDRQTLSEIQKSPRTSADVQEKTLANTADDYQLTASTGDFGSENQLTKSFVETDDNLQYEDSISYATDEKVSSEIDRNERRQLIDSDESSSIEKFEDSLHTKPNESRSLSFALTSTPQEERKENRSQSDANILPKSKLKENETSYQIKREEDTSSSLRNQTEENNSNRNISSEITTDYNLNELNSLLPPDASKQSSNNTSFADVEEGDSSTSQKLEIRSDDDDDPNLAVVMQELRYVFHELANDEDFVEINNDLPDKILDRLEFRDHFIRTLFDSLIKKYLIQPSVQGARPETLDWVEFRDILFPIISGRYTERHIRKLFDLFDTSGDGYLSLQEIAELLEVLHANDTIDLAQNIIDEFDTDHDGKLSVDELIEAMKNTDDINEHALSEETEHKQWFNQSPTETQTITLEVPVVNFSSKIDEKFTEKISLLGKIFKRLGASSDSKQLDSNQKNLLMNIKNEFINNNINISSDHLQLFIQLFLDKKRNTDSLIDWIEFQDIFFPIINNGFYSKNNIKRWFDIFDINQNGVITQEQIMQLLHLLQIQNTDEITNKLNEITDYADSCTVDELTFALDTVDETASHLLTNTEQISSFDINWLSNNIF